MTPKTTNIPAAPGGYLEISVDGRQDSRRRLTAGEFARETLTPGPDDTVLAAPVTVVCIGDDGRIHWQSRHTTRASLLALARELLAESPPG